MLEQLTLHQLRALLVLLEEASVTRAARRLGLSQPALSHQLRGLRELLGDPLLVGGRAGMLLTPRAAAMLPALRRALHDLERALAAQAEDPRSWRRRLVLATWDGVTIRLLPALLRLLGERASGLDLDVVPVAPEGSGSALEEGRVDLSLEVRPSDSPGLRSRSLGEDSFACLVRRDHPRVGAELDLETWLSLPHALISPQGGGQSVVDRALAERGLQRRIALRIRYFLAAPLIVAQTDLVLVAPRSLCESLLPLAPLRLLPTPLPLAPFQLRMVWHERMQEDPVHRWLREAVVEAAKTEGRGPAPGPG